MANKSPSTDSNPPTPLQGMAPARSGALLALVLTTAFVVTIAFAMFPSSPWTRVRQVDGTIYSNLIWARQRIFLDKTPIDVAIIGDSRMKFGVSGPLLETTLEQKIGRPIHVANFATLHEGRDLHYLLARDLIPNHPELRVLVLSIVEIPIKDSHPTFYLLAEPADLLSAPVLSFDYFPNLLKLPYRQLSLFFSEWMETAGPLPPYPGSNPETTGLGTERDRIVPAKQFVGAKRLLRDWMHGSHNLDPVLLPERFRQFEFAPDYSYLDKISALARSHNIKVIMVFQPSYGYNEPPVYENSYGKYGPLLNLREFSTDSSIHADVFHTNRAGTRLMTEKIAAAVAEQIH